MLTRDYADQINSLEARVTELTIALIECREQAAMNRHNPGNENDTLEYIESTVSNVLQDGYEYVPEDEDDCEYFPDDENE